jgi:hypothetical protein
MKDLDPEGRTNQPPAEKHPWLRAGFDQVGSLKK